MQLVGHAPRQKLVDAIDFMVSDVSEHIVQIGARIDVVQCASPDQRVHCGGPFTAAVGTGKQEILPPMHIIALAE